MLQILLQIYDGSGLVALAINNKVDKKKLSCNFHLANFYLVNSFFSQSERESRLVFLLVLKRQ